MGPTGKMTAPAAGVVPYEPPPRRRCSSLISWLSIPAVDFLGNDGQDSRRMNNVKGGMPWSKLRSTIRGLICLELRRRIDFHVTSYRHSHGGAEKAWITIDGKRVLTSSWYQHQWYGWPRDRKGRLDWEAQFPKHINKEKHEVHLPQELGDALRAYVDLPIGAALKSAKPLYPSIEYR